MTIFRGTFRALQGLALAGSLVLAFAQSGCEKKRGLRFTQGSGENVFEISQYNGKTFKVATGEKRFKGQTSRADELVTLNGFDQINNLDAVEFEIQDGLFSEINISDFNFYGRENFQYTFKYSFSDNYVILSKVASKDDIPSQELTFAQEVGNGLFEVPLMGLPISLFTVERVKDERGKATRQLNTFARDFLNQASHFKVNPGEVKYFEAPAKPDLFAADFFNSKDEWFFTKTLVGRSIKSTAILGETAASLKIKFARTNNSLIGVDLNIAEEQEILDPTKTITALEIPVQWVDFRTETAGADARLKESILGDKEGGSRFWKERRYALVDFNNADRLDKAFTLDNKLEKLEVSNDYVSFIIYESSSGNTYKYSLAKSNRRVAGQRFFAEDAKKFHIFTQRRTVIQGALQNQDPDIDKITYASRFFPENKEIVYHITKNSPQDKEFIEAVEASVQAWNLAFQEANTGIQVRLSNDRVDLGDVRYNAIALYGYEIDSGRLLGFGPSVQDTRNGETFSAATHIYLRSYREGVITSIRNFIRNELGLYDDKLVTQLPSFTNANAFVVGGGLINSPVPNLSSLVSLDKFFQNTPDMFAAEGMAAFRTQTFGSNEVLEAVEDYAAKTAKTKTTQEKLLYNANGPKCDYGSIASVANSWNKIREVCANGNGKFASYLSGLKKLHSEDKTVLNDEGEEEAILACAQPLMKDLLTSTLIHEIGHNLGLGHNFAASSESPENQAKNADGSIAYPSSSVMDYPDRDFDLYSKAGPYDVAAIRYLYTKTVETTDKEFIKVADNMSMTAAVSKVSKKLKPYRMCTDYEVDGDTNLANYDPMCSRWDVGSTPDKYVQWAIAQVQADIVQNGYRYNNKGFSGSVRSLVYLDHFRQIQEYFRFLVASQAGIYFERLSAPAGSSPETSKAALESLIAQNIKNNPRDGQLMRSYYDAVTAIFNFANDVVNLPTRTCLVQDNTGITSNAVEFSTLRRTVYDRLKVTVQNCGEASMLIEKMVKENVLGQDPNDYFSKFAGMALVDRGIEVNGLELDLNPEAAADKWKQIYFATLNSDLDPRFSSGSRLLKSKVIELLTSRKPTLDLGVAGRGNFLDYPWFASELYNNAWNTVLVGNKGMYIDNTLLGQKVYQHYQDTESLLPAYLFELYEAGLNPNSPSFRYALEMQPNKEASLSVFNTGPGAGESDIWYTVNTANEVLYAENNSVAGQMIKLFVSIGQLNGFIKTYFDLKETVDQEIVTRVQQQLSTSFKELSISPSTEDELVKVATAYLEGENGLGASLQPAQKKALRAAVKEALATDSSGLANIDAKVEILKPLLADFAYANLNLRLLDSSMDSNNISSLYRILNSVMSSF